MKKNLFNYIAAVLLLAFCSFGAIRANAEQRGLQQLQVNLDSNWELAYFNMDDTQWIAEYGIKGEDVVNFKWTKLITVNCINNMPPAVTTDFYVNQFKTLLKNQANNMGRELYFENLPSSSGEKWFEWSIKGRGEVEICRVFKQATLFITCITHKKNQSFLRLKETA